MSLPASILPTGEGTPRAWLQALADGCRTGCLTHVEVLAERAAVVAPWPQWVAPTVVSAFEGAGVRQLWRHQRQAAELAHDGHHLVLATGTASGKSLGYLVPMLSELTADSAQWTRGAATGLYLAPTKALAADQEARLRALAVPGVRAALYDGDTAPDERRWAREHANLVLTNPDLLHHSLMPGHARWSRFLRGLRYVVVDECHAYRGVFGSHVGAVLRRLRRIAEHYGAHPVFILASATVADPGAHGEALTGLPMIAVDDDASPRGAQVVGLWRPGPADSDDPDSPPRSASTEAAGLLASLVDLDVQTLVFARSRAGAESVALGAQRRLPRAGAERVAAYRGGYLPEERRALERSLRSRELLGVAATNALELGVDIGGLDAVVTAGWPGRRSSLWQQFGRAGRGATASLAIFVAGEDPLDQYVVSHPDSVFGRPTEASVVDSNNPYVLTPHLAAAAAELPLRDPDLDLFGPNAPQAVETLTTHRILRRRPTGWYWARTDRPGDHLSLRGALRTVSIVERSTGRVVGTLDGASAPSQLHAGAVHLHQGRSFVVTDLDLESGVATVVAGDPGWSTTAESVSDFRIVSTERSVSSGRARVYSGTVTVTGQVTGFLRRLPSGEVIGRHKLDLPSSTLRTTGVWWTLSEGDLADHGVDEVDIPGAAHAAEHAAIGVLPLFASCDRWDIGGVSTALHPDTGLPTVMVYDGYPGGAGFARRAFDRFEAWTAATRDAIAWCGCSSGCPSCVQSPKCGNGNEPLDKQGALRWLALGLP